jgi:predicted dehydrogenase
MSSPAARAAATPCQRRPLRLGFVGAGSFLRDHFAPTFKAHPGVAECWVADLELPRAQALADHHGFAGAVRTLDELIARGVDAVAIFTPRHTHTPLAIQAMRAGVDVYSAVPAATSLAELRELVTTVEATRRIYMTGETSYYYPEAIYLREEFATGSWGKFVYAEAQYTHDMATWGPHFRLSYGAEWRRYAALPPMLYGTHSFSMPLSVTGARVTHISAHGFIDHVPGSGYGTAGENPWNNPFSNQVALARTSDGGALRIAEFRRVGWFARRNGREVMMPHFYCTDACFEENAESALLLARQGHEGGMNWEHDGGYVRDLGPWINGPYFEHPVAGAARADHFVGLAPAHPAHRLPAAFKGLGNGHNGSHQFLVDDFVWACLAGPGTSPPCNVWASAKWAAPGLVAHESSLQGGSQLPVPDFGEPPADWRTLDFGLRPDVGQRPSPPPLRMRAEADIGKL